jgi:4-hydroxybenzoate polyprenyltransferase
MTRPLDRMLSLLVYPNIFIAFCALMMSWETQYLYGFQDNNYLAFIFCSTLASYNAHSLINRVYQPTSARHTWNFRNRNVLIILFLVSGAATIWFFLPYRHNPLPFIAGGVLTFLYSAPNLEGKAWTFLRKIAIGKTIYLAAVWTYATTILPLLAQDKGTDLFSGFLGSRFYLVYAICILFDLRDREEDRLKGIKALPTMLNNQWIRYFYFGSLIISAFFSIQFTLPGWEATTVILLIPALLLLPMYRYAAHRTDDALYFLYLDGLMMLSALLHAVYFSFTFVS